MLIGPVINPFNTAARFTGLAFLIGQHYSPVYRAAHDPIFRRTLLIYLYLGITPTSLSGFQTYSFVFL